MWVYVLIIGISIGLYFVHGDRQRMNPWLMGGCMLALALFVGLSDMLGGYDRYIYAELFDGMADIVQRKGNIYNATIYVLYEKEFGYGVLNQVIALFTANRYIFILIFTLIIYSLVFISIMKYTNRSPLVIVLFLGLWFFFTFTYLRQVLAASIAWLAIQYAIDRKPIQFFAIVFVAFSIHNSAIMFAPVYFLPMKKFNVGAVLAVMGICLVIGTTDIAGTLFEQYGEVTEQEQRMAQNMREAAGGFRIEYLLEAVVFLVFIFWKYNDINEENKTQVMMCNLAFVFCAVLLLFIRNENGGRLSWFFMMGLFSILSFLATKHKGISVYGMALAGMCAILFMRIVITWGILVAPYKTFLTPGHRDGDVIYEQYEYDHKYDHDKFYR